MKRLVLLIGGSAIAVLMWALCVAAKRSDELMADMQRAGDFTRRETEVGA